MAKPKKYTRDTLIWAFNECRKDPGILASCMADKVDGNSRYMTEELMRQVEAGLFIVEKHGNAYLFKLNPDAMKSPQ